MNKIIFAFSILIACGLWFYIYVGEERELTFTLPIVLTNIPEDRMAFVNPKVATVKAKGPHVLAARAIEDITIPINVGGLPLGSTTMRISQRDININGMVVMDLSPFRYEVVLENTIQLEVPVEPFILDTPPVGYKVDSVKTSPSSVTIEGTQRDVSQLTNVRTHFISVKDLKGVYRTTVDLIEYEELKSISPTMVTVEITISEDIITRNLRLLPARCANGEKLQDIPQVDVKLTGRRDIIENLGPIPLINLDCSVAEEPGEYTVPVIEQSIEGVTFDSITPGSVKITVIE